MNVFVLSHQTTCINLPHKVRSATGATYALTSKRTLLTSSNTSNSVGGRACSFWGQRSWVLRLAFVVLVPACRWLAFNLLFRTYSSSQLPLSGNWHAAPDVQRCFWSKASICVFCSGRISAITSNACQFPEVATHKLFLPSIMYLGLRRLDAL